jgi:hypothetical protein
MWLAIPVVILVILAIVGGILVSGIYAAVLLPIVVLILIGVGIAVFKRSIDPDFRARREERAKMPLGGDTGPHLLPGGRTVVRADQLQADPEVADDEQLAARQRTYRERQPGH